MYPETKTDSIKVESEYKPHSPSKLPLAGLSLDNSCPWDILLQTVHRVTIQQ